MSVQWSAPPSSSSTLEAKMEELRCKVEQLLSERSCVMCGLCVWHQEAQAAQISIFSSLDHKLTEMRTALEELAHGLEDKQRERTSVPLVALQRRKSLPVRTSAQQEEVYVRLSAGRDGKNASYVKGLLGEMNKTNRIKIENHSAKSALSEVKVHPDAKLKSKVERENSQTKTDTAKNQQAKKPCMAENKSQNDAKTFFVAAGAAIHKTQAVIPPREEVKDDTHPSAKKTLPDSSDLKRAESASKSTVNLKVPDFSARPVTSTPCMVSPALHNPPKSTQSGVPTSSSPTEKSPKTSVLQSLGKPPVNAAKTKTPTPQDSTLLPAKPASFNTNPAALRHVHSCPNALQRSQVTADSGNAVNHTAGGIQITVTPAADKILAHLKDRSPPKTCSTMIDDVSPQPAPFPHRFVSLKSSPPPCDTFSIHTREVLGGGRFGKVHKCTEVVKGLRLAAKIINTRNPREKEMAVNEIQVMNQLSHANVLQLYDAFEIKNQVVLILEFVEGGELFERIVDESCFLTEVDAMVFVKQICEGVQYMHQMYVLHLDLKPENILLVNRCSHQVKIIDFGLARRYKPREKLKVSFGTPEFLAPEVVNFDFVSFPTDMWTLGVVTYMLLSGLSPFLGDDDSQTLNNVLMGNWYFDEDAFEHVSAEARDFITNLLIRERSGRLSATQCLKHPWLNNISEKAKSHNIVLKSQVLLKKYMARRLWKKNYIAIAAANRFKKIGSSGSLTSMGF